MPAIKKQKIAGIVGTTKPAPLPHVIVKYREDDSCFPGMCVYIQLSSTTFSISKDPLATTERVAVTNTATQTGESRRFNQQLNCT